MVAVEDQPGTKKEDADDDDITQEIADRRCRIHPAEHVEPTTCVFAIVFAETLVGEINGCVSLDDFQASDGFVSKRDKVGIHLLHHLRRLLKFARDAGDDESDYRQHAEHK